jgi:hypothetical protein
VHLAPAVHIQLSRRDGLDKNCIVQHRRDARDQDACDASAQERP